MASESVPGFSGWGLGDQGSRGSQEISPFGDIHSRVLGSQPGASTSLSVLLSSPHPSQLSLIFLPLLWQGLMPLAMTHPQLLSAQVQPA